MKDFNAKAVEELGYEASRLGFFKQWQELSSSISKTEDINLSEAAERAFKRLKLMGSE
tara:strand:+ start:31 stop:204 length:174 start_codon:yes stop_codon:yes gene_type:complete